MIKIQIDLSKKIPAKILSDITNLLENVNNSHKDLKVDKINEAKKSVKIAEPKEYIAKEEIKENTLVSIVNETNECPVKLFNDEKYDVRGFSWDERIHAKTKAKKVDGTWRYKRGVEKDLIEKVEIEQKLKSAPIEKEEIPVPQTMSFEPTSFTVETFKPVMFDYINSLLTQRLIDRNDLIELNNSLGLTTGLVELLTPENAEKVGTLLDALVSANLAKRV